MGTRAAAARADGDSPPRSRLRSPLWFSRGVAGGWSDHVYRASGRRPRESSADFNGDGIDDEIYHYNGNVLDRVELRSQCRRQDRCALDLRLSRRAHRATRVTTISTDASNGQSDAEEGQIVTSTLDSNGDGRPDAVIASAARRDAQRRHLRRSRPAYRRAGRPIDGALNTSTEFDADGDGVFERRVEYDRYGEPKAK